MFQLSKNNSLKDLNEYSFMIRDSIEMEENTKPDLMEEFRYSQINNLNCFMELQKVQKSFIKKSKEVI